MLTDPDEVDKTSKSNHVDFVPSNNAERRIFKRFLIHEIKLRLPLQEAVTVGSGTIEQMRTRLRLFVEDELAVEKARDTTERYKKVEEAVEAVVAELIVPCILHLNMRVTEKVFHRLMCGSLDRFSDSNQDRKNRKSLAKVVESWCNTGLFGTESRSGQWSFHGARTKATWKRLT